MVEAVIYDMDGTLVDSERLGVVAWHIVGERYGTDVPDDVIKTFIGGNADKVHEVLYEYLDGDRELADRVYDWHIEVLDELYPTDLELKLGARESLEALHAAGCRLGLATSTGRERALARLERFDLLDLFDAATCGDEVSRSKPAPDIFLTAAERLGVDPANCAVAEDSFNGVRAAHAAGMHVFMVPDIVLPTAEIEGLCDEVLTSLHELPAAVGRVL